MRTDLKCTLSAFCLFGLAGLASCQSQPPDAPASPDVVPVASTVPAADQDSCHAASYQSLLGSDYKQAPSAPVGKVIRVLCTTCPMTMDFSPERLNIFYDKDSGVISRLSCG